MVSGIFGVSSVPEAADIGRDELWSNVQLVAVKTRRPQKITEHEKSRLVIEAKAALRGLGENGQVAHRPKRD